MWKLDVHPPFLICFFLLTTRRSQADELSELFGERMPKRLTAARYLWSLRHEPHKTERCVALTTPAGYIAHKLTAPGDGDSRPPASMVLGVGEASGMFPIADDNDDADDGYRTDWIAAFDGHVRAKFPNRSVPSLGDLLPIVRRAGDTRPGHGGDGASVVLNRSVVLGAGGWLSEVRGLFLGNENNDDTGDREVLVAPAEGDQPTALAASLIGRHGMISCSFGTSVVANMVGKSTGGTKSKARASLAAVDRFNAVNGQPISMVWLRNGTTYLNRIIDSYGGDFEALLQRALAAPPDCGGLLALPFLDDEPGRNVARGGTGTILGFGSSSGNHDAGNIVKAAMVSVMFNLYLGTQQVEAAEGDGGDGGDSPTTTNREIVLTGGLTKTPGTGQVLADIFDRPVRLLEAADEGGAWGAALLAKYSHDCRHRSSDGVLPPPPDDWLDFLASIEATEQQSFSPHPEAVKIYRSVLAKYKRLLELQPALDRVVNGP